MIEQILSYRPLFFNIVPTVSYSFSPAMNKNLDAMLIQIAPAPWPAVAIAETHHPLPPCTHSHCLVSANIQQASMDVNRYLPPPIAEFSDTPCLHMHFHVKCFCLLPSVALKQNATKYGGEGGGEGSTFTAVPPGSFTLTC